MATSPARLLLCGNAHIRSREWALGLGCGRGSHISYNASSYSSLNPLAIKQLKNLQQL